MKPQLKLADAIERALRGGQRIFLLQGAELDWVIEALRALTSNDSDK